MNDPFHANLGDETDIKNLSKYIDNYSDGKCKKSTQILKSPDKIETNNKL